MLGEFVPLDPQHIGTRLDHIVELYDLWNTGLSLLNRAAYTSAYEKEQVADLEAGLKLLYKHITFNYNQYMYGREINNLPKPEPEKGDK